jgi:hypothetical protein
MSSSFDRTQASGESGNTVTYNVSPIKISNKPAKLLAVASGLCFMGVLYNLSNLFSGHATKYDLMEAMMAAIPLVPIFIAAVKLFNLRVDQNIFIHGNRVGSNLNFKALASDIVAVTKEKSKGVVEEYDLMIWTRPYGSSVRKFILASRLSDDTATSLKDSFIHDLRTGQAPQAA